MDFETVPDFDQVPGLVGEDLADDKLYRLDRLRKYMRDCGQEEHMFFPPLSLHKIIVPSILIASINVQNQFEYSYKVTHLSSTFSDNDAETLKSLVQWLGHRPRIVTYNGRSFELPLLKMRCLHHKIPCGVLWLTGDKYDNYDSRYTSTWHVDMMDVMASHGAARFVKLREATACARLPGKIFGSGRDVLHMYLDGKTTEIQNYCEMDVLETFLLYVRWQYIKQIIPEEGYLESVHSVLKLLMEKSSEKPHYSKFLEEWTKSDPDIVNCIKTL